MPRAKIWRGLESLSILPKILNCLEGELFATDCIFCAKTERASLHNHEARAQLPNYKGRKICSECACEIKQTKTGNLLIATQIPTQVPTQDLVQVLPYASLSPYEGKAKALILRLKTVKDEALVLDLAKLLSQPLAVLLNYLYKDRLTDKPPLLVPVPLHEARLKERGYNQSELLARALAAELPRLSGARPWTKSRKWKTQPHWASPEKQYLAAGLLERVKCTESQQGLSMPQRSANMDGAFRLTAQLDGRPIIIIDDVLTSGATAGNCAAAIYSAACVDGRQIPPGHSIKIGILTVARARWRQ